MRLVGQGLAQAAGVAVLLLVGAPATAHAAGVTLTNPATFNVLFGGNIDGTNVPQLSAAATVHFLGFTTTATGNTTASFDISLANTTNSTANPSLTSRVSGFAFDIDPDPQKTGSGVSGIFTKMILDGSLPNGFGAVDVCVNDGGGQSCQGGGNGGIAKGATDSFLLTLSFAGAVNSMTLDNFGVRYQSIDGRAISGGPKFNGASGTGTGTPGGFTPDPNVPEPAALLLLGVGLTAAAVQLKRRRKRNQPSAL